MDRRPGLIFVLIAMIAVSANLRPAISSVPPLLDTIRDGLGLSHAAAGLITTIPVLMMGIIPVFAAMAAARAGSERLVLAALLLVGGGILLRLIEYPSFMYLSAALAGIGIAGAQTLLPDIAKRRFRDGAATVMSVQACAMTAGAGIAAVLTPDVQAATGSWSAALAWWSAPAALGAVIWLAVIGLPRSAPGAGAGGFGFPLRSAIAWRITLLGALSSGMFYTTLTWIPPTYTEAGWSTAETGTLLLVFSVTQLAASLGVTWLTGRSRDRRAQLLASLGLAAIGCAGLAAAPLAAPWLWVSCVGLATGALFPLSLILPVDYEDRPDALRRLAAMSLTGGYVLAAAGPVLFGWMREASGDYLWSYGALAVWAAATAGMSLYFRPRRPLADPGPLQP
ncbi:MFS transporter [Iodidimonas sp. SYSU 1G8]|uniref:MFS transporter n=1 Tax=Iodidimonas sp. SYSU 1G8 TaxID=3133967 RepID=UPI0031FEEB22